MKERSRPDLEQNTPSGGMAEWSMAVVLKTSAGNFTSTSARSGQILRDLADLRTNSDNRSAEFRS
jgi:hypothetical protein